VVRFALARLVQAIPSLLGGTIAAFVLLQLSGDVTQILLPPQADDQVRLAFKQAYGLDQPILLQYGHYLSRLVQGDFGRSFAYAQPAMLVVLERLPATLELSAAAISIAVAVAIPAGMLSAVKRGSAFDRLAMGFVLLGQSVPTFWLGMLLILVFAVHFLAYVPQVVRSLRADWGAARREAVPGSGLRGLLVAAALGGAAALGLSLLPAMDAWHA